MTFRRTRPKISRRSVIALVFAACASQFVARAHAQPDATDAPAPEQRAWAKGVPAETQRAATRLYAAGNELMNQLLFAKALDKYQRALELWDHPGIRFNAAVALIKLGQVIAAHDNITAALRFGQTALGAADYEEALNYRQLLEAQLSTIDIVCDEPGVTVTVDGQKWLVGPGRVQRKVNPGEHQLVASKAERLTLTETVAAWPGKRQTVEVRLVPISEATVLKRRFAAWKPWTVVGAGVLTTLIGVPLQLRSRTNMDTYDRGLLEQCSAGCSRDALPAHVRDAETRAILQNRLAVTAFITGGVLTIAGVAGVLFNQPRRIAHQSRANISLDAIRRDRPFVTPIVAPIVAADRFGIAILSRF